jgi:hypothetical protein
VTLLANRVMELSNTVGAGSFILLGAAVSHRSFAEGVGVGNRCYYVAEAVETDVDGDLIATGDFEIGAGTLASPTILTRERIITSSTGGTPVFFSPGTKRVYVDCPAEAIETYTHVQSFAATVWTVTHNLGKFPSVTVIDSGNNKVYGGVEYLSADQLKLTFSVAFGGKAYLN